MRYSELRLRLVPCRIMKKIMILVFWGVLFIGVISLVILDNWWGLVVVVLPFVLLAISVLIVALIVWFLFDLPVGPGAPLKLAPFPQVIG